MGVPQYIRQALRYIKGKINSNTIIVGDFNAPLTPMNRSSRQKIAKETQALNKALTLIDLIGIYKAIYCWVTQ